MCFTLKWTQSTASRTSWNMLLKDMKRSPSLKPVSQLGEGSKDTHVHSRRTGHSFIEGFQKHDICFLFAFKWDSLPLLEGSPAKQENILPLKDQQPGFRGQRTCNHSRLHSQKKNYRPLNLLTLTVRGLSCCYIRISFSANS